jgi:hypothetical protein
MLPHRQLGEVLDIFLPSISRRPGEEEGITTAFATTTMAMDYPYDYG